MSNTEVTWGLTPKQMAFANDLAAGMGPSEAYRKNYATKGAARVVSVSAQEAKNNPKVAAYLAHLIAKQERRKALIRERKRELLEKCAEDETADWGKRIKAIEVDNTMTGDNAPQQVQVFGLSELLAMVRKKST